MDQVHEWLATLRDILPQYLMDSLKHLYFHVVFLGKYLLSVSFDSINLQTILPPIVSLFAIYFALISLYHTTTFFVRTTIFLVKWGALIGALGITLGYVANVAMPESFSPFNPNSARRKPSRARNVKPRPWDSFDQHRRWQETQQETASFASDAAQFAQGIMDKIVATTHGGGWLGRVTSLTVNQIIRENTPMGQGTGDRERALKKCRGGAKSR